jgi:uncharacterized membrane protein SirB2
VEIDYPAIKLLHQSAVALSSAGFVVRGIAALRGAQWTQGRLAKSLPHVVDTVLLLSAVTLTAMLHINPVHAPWLIAKILGLLLYIGLGMVALRANFGRTTRSTSFVLALVVLAWIASVALSKSPWGFLSTLTVLFSDVPVR